MPGKHDEPVRCSFCRKSILEVKKLVASPKEPLAHICNECIAVFGKRKGMAPTRPTRSRRMNKG